jgi:hypothetical protein
MKFLPYGSLVKAISSMGSPIFLVPLEYPSEGSRRTATGQIDLEVTAPYPLSRGTLVSLLGPGLGASKARKRDIDVVKTIPSQAWLSPCSDDTTKNASITRLDEVSSRKRNLIFWERARCQETFGSL